MIPRGTTAVIEYVFKTIDPANIVECYLTIVQGDVTIEKDLDDATVGTNKLTWQLTQAETLRFNASKDIERQIRYLTSDGNAYISPVTKTKSYRVLKDGVITAGE